MSFSLSLSLSSFKFLSSLEKVLELDFLTEVKQRSHLYCCAVEIMVLPKQ